MVSGYRFPKVIRHNGSRHPHHDALAYFLFEGHLVQDRFDEFGLFHGILPFRDLTVSSDWYILVYDSMKYSW